MSVISQLQNLAGSLRVRTGAPLVSRATVAEQPSYSTRSDFLEARSRLLRIERALETLADLTGIRTRFKLDLPDARSAASLGLDLTTTAAALASTGDINAAPRSFTPFGPNWNDGSTALLTIGGEYDGTNGTGALTFEVRRAGTKGDDDLRIRVYDPEGDRIRNINIRASHDPDRQYSINNGLYLTLGEGDLFNRDLAFIDVSDSIGAAVDPDKPLAGIRNESPNFQYYEGQSALPTIVDGAFEVNGELISVGPGDTINSVIERVNQSAAGVTAVFNAGTERIEFLQNTTGAAPTIDLQNDTSNFLISTKLETASVTPGIDPDTLKALNDVAAFSAVQSGDIVINGTTIAVDAGSDSLTTVLAKINGSAAGVRATFDEAAQKVTIEANESASELTIDGNDTGLFAALNIPEGRVDPEVRARGISRRRSYALADAFETLAKEMNALFQDSFFEQAGISASVFRGPLDTAIQNAFGASESRFGLSIDRSADARRRGDFAAVDRAVFARNLQRRGDEVKAFLAGVNGDGGLIGELTLATLQALDNVGAGLARTGTYVDTFA